MATLAGCSGDARAPGPATASLRIVKLRTDSRQNPLGIDARTPHLSWQLESSARGVRQSAYQIRIARSAEALHAGTPLLFDSGKIMSDQSTHVKYPSPPLQSRQRYAWQVRVWDAGGQGSEWSAPASWEMGLLSPHDWVAKWISPQFPEDPVKPGPAAMLRTAFEVSGNVTRARVYVTSHGLYELHLNDQRVGDAVLTPGWTSYAHRVQYQTYDVTDQLRAGANAIGALLGDGWYRGTLGFVGKRHQFGDQVALLMQLEITYADGHTQTVSSDGNWKAATGPILRSDLYKGETYDARLERSGWASAGYDDRDWWIVHVIPAPPASIIAQAGPTVRRMEELTPVRIFKTPAGSSVADMGQNMVGWVRLRVSGPAGAKVTLRHAEVLDKDGNFYTDNLRTAEQRIEYILKGEGEEVFEPHFTFQGFRYVSVEGYPGELRPQNLTGIVIYSDMERTSQFETSSPLINQLQRNIVWGQKGNFVDVPTDCPQRDERLGWTGDAQAFSATAAFNMDVEGFFTKWLGDLAAEQLDTGNVPWVVPDVIRTFALGRQKPGNTETIAAAGAAGWSDAATIIPWNLYLAYGNKDLLATQYESMVKWLAYEQARAGSDHLWSGDFHFGDWLDFFSAARNTNFGSTSTDLIATAFYAHSADILERAARVLEKHDDARRHGELFAHIKDAFTRTFVTPEGGVGDGTQTAYVLALDFDLLPADLRAKAAARLAQDVRERGHLTTGFLGTPHLLNVLSRFGYLDEAYRLLNRTEFPSWLYPVTKGATTIWERWDGIRPDGSFQNAAMNSFNHYAYGAVGEWMYSVVAGINIDPNAPGYQHIVIKPQPGGGLTRARASHASPYGEVSVSWQWMGNTFDLQVEIPPNSTATVILPDAKQSQVLEAGRLISASNGILRFHQDGPDVVIEIGSGRYDFRHAK